MSENQKQSTLKKIFPLLSSVNLLTKNGLIITACLIIATSGYLQWRKIQNKQVLGETQEAQVIATPKAIFSSEVMPIRNKTLIKVTYKPSQNPSIIWLKLKTKPEAKQVIKLLYHPLLFNLNWIQVSNGSYSLYQKNKNYDTVEQFLENIPIDRKIVADAALTNTIFKDYKIPYLSVDTKLDEIDYIFTTYHQPFKDKDFYVFETMIDATDGLVTNNNLSWELDMPSINENNPMLLKQVDIVYNQPN